MNFSFITNGYDPVSVFNTANDSSSLLPSNPRIQGIRYEIVKVTKFNGRFKSISNPNTNNPGVEAGEFFITEGLDSPLNQAKVDQEFNIQGYLLVNGTNTSQVYYKKITDDDFNSGSPNGYRGCHIYHIELQLSDASGGPNSLSSAIYSVVFIITKNKDIL